LKKSPRGKPCLPSGGVWGKCWIERIALQKKGAQLQKVTFSD